MSKEYTVEWAKEWDKNDSLNSFKQQFHIPQINGKDSIYFCGNSLGLMPKNAEMYLKQDLEDWANLGVEGHFKGKQPWFSYHTFTQNNIAKLVGATNLEVVAMNQLTVNLHLLFATFYKPTNTRFKILMEKGAFPSDMYMVESQLTHHGITYKNGLIELAPREGEFALREEDIEKAILDNGNELAMVFLPGVQYYTGQTFDIETITKLAHKVGAIAGFDLAHATGNIPLQLNKWQVDFATWCSYKYLNSGPGNVSGVFIHENHFNSKLNRFAGWWGHIEEERFKMLPGFNPSNGAAGWQLSNANVFGLAIHQASLDIFITATEEKLSHKSNALTKALRACLTEAAMQNNQIQMDIITPINTFGAQLSVLMHKNGKSLFTYLENNGVICDWREPNVIRMAPVPLYNTMLDVIMVGELFKNYK